METPRDLNFLVVFSLSNDFFLSNNTIYVSISIKLSSDRNPVRLIIRVQQPCNKENNIHNPPDANTAQGQQFTNTCSSLTQTESIHTWTKKQMTLNILEKIESNNQFCLDNNNDLIQQL